MKRVTGGRWRRIVLGHITTEVIGSVEKYENARMMFRMFSTDVFSQCLA